MSDHHRHDDALLGQIDHLLEQGRPTDEPLVNTLAQTRPAADPAFQQALEQRLMAHLQTRPPEKDKATMHLPLTTRPTNRPLAPLTWAVTLATVALALMALVLINHRSWLPLTNETPSAVAQVEPSVSLVVALQDIDAGTAITGDMIGSITLATADMDKIRLTQADRSFIVDTQAVVGQTAARDIGSFQPFETALFEPVAVPETYSTIGLPLQPDTLQGLEIGDRVDVLAWLDEQLRVLVADVLISDITPTAVMFAVPRWQMGVLGWFSYHHGESYALRLHTGATAPTPDTTPVEYTLTVPDAPPEDLDFDFDVIVSVPLRTGYLLTELPSPIDDNMLIRGNEDRLYFVFHPLEVVSISDGATVIVRLPQGDAANLDYLLGIEAANMGIAPHASS